MKKIEQRIEKLENIEQTGNIAILFEPKEGANQEEHAAHRKLVEQEKADGGQVIVVGFRGTEPRLPEQGITYMAASEAYRLMCNQLMTAPKGPAMSPEKAYRIMTDGDGHVL